MLAEDLPPIRAVHDDELSDFLRSIGVLDAFEAGDLRCRFCDIVIDETNLHAIFPADNNIYVVCDKATCQGELSTTNIPK